MENEANILDRLNCPHIVRCLGKGKEYCSMTQRKCNNNNNNNNNIVFMEYMAGGSLCDVIKTFGG
ncbi:MAG: hypothetical protein N7Q72_07500, partial [Spiroplasma sp. Tabriz.8]|nr:hypothetical protein [Spiroplasma sp. Tabriz.8]